MEGGKKTGLGSIFLVLFVDLIGFSIVFPLFPEMMRWYGDQSGSLLALLMQPVDALFPGVDPLQRAALFGGLLGALYAGLQFIAAPFWGRMSDRYGRRPILLVSLVGSLVANLLWVFSGSFSVLLLSRLLAGAMTGNIAVANAAVADVTTSANRSKGMAAVGMAFGLGFILGPAMGGWLGHIRLDQALPALVHGGSIPSRLRLWSRLAWRWSICCGLLWPSARRYLWNVVASRATRGRSIRWPSSATTCRHACMPST